MLVIVAPDPVIMQVSPAFKAPVADPVGMVPAEHLSADLAGPFLQFMAFQKVDDLIRDLPLDFQNFLVFIGIAGQTFSEDSARI